MKEFKDSKSAENLLKAFAGESQARNRYTFYAKVARKEGLRQIEALFLETAENERSHAKLYYNQLLKNGLNGSALKITAEYPIALGTTVENLGYAAKGENEEWTTLYPTFAKIAEEEGYPEVAKTFLNISRVEEKHEARYNKLLNNMKTEHVFKKDAKVQWKCAVCGHIVESFSAPKNCPVCDHPQEHFEMFVENY